MIRLTDAEICILSRVWHASNKSGADNWQEQRISDWLQEQVVSTRSFLDGEQRKVFKLADELGQRAASSLAETMKQTV